MQRVYSTTQTLAAGASLISSAISLPQAFSVATPLQMAASADAGIVEQTQLTASVYSDQPGFLLFQQSDNPNKPNFWESIGCYSVAPATLLSVPAVSVRKLYWRFIYQNTGSQQSQFELDINGFNSSPPAVDMYGKLYTQGVDSYYTS